jgi:hypothetical protein
MKRARCTVGELNNLANLERRLREEERARELKSIKVISRFSVRIARDPREYERSVVPSAELLQRLAERGTDVFTFIERRWCSETRYQQNSWGKADTNIALLSLGSYDEWWKGIGKKTRNMIRKAEKSGIRTNVVEPDEKLAEGIWRIYNGTPIRQGRAFLWYGFTLQQVKTDLCSGPNYAYIGAFLNDELVGFVRLIYAGEVTIIAQILSLEKHWNKAVNNALIAKAVEVCASRGVKWIMYGRMGDFRRHLAGHSSLDDFKLNNGFRLFQLTRYYMPLTRKGVLAIKLGLRLEMRDMLPQSIKYVLIPIYYWLARTRAIQAILVRLFEFNAQ